MIGKIFGKWMIIAFSHKNKNYQKFWLCRCECGIEKVIDQSRLISGDARRCQHCANKARRLYKPIKIGNRYGKWTVISFKENNSDFVTIKCNCSKIQSTHEKYLRYGRMNRCSSCANIRHGYNCKGRVKPEYRAWCNMKNRVLNQKIKNFSNYGGRGIKIHKPWIDSFDEFLKDVGVKLSDKHSLERLDVNGNYEPGNVIWALPKQQVLNKRHMYEYKGKKISLRVLSKRLNVQPRTLKKLLFQANFSIEDIAIYSTLGHFQKTQMGISLNKNSPYILKDLLKIRDPQPSKRHPLWYTWHSIKQRTSNPKNKDYKYYGARGLKVDKELETFEGFLNVIENYLGPKPSKHSQLDRINPNGNYEKNNLRWTTAHQQAINKRNSLKINGKSVSAQELSKKYGLYQQTTIQLIRNGWDEKGLKWYSNLSFKEKKAKAILVKGLQQPSILN